MSSDVDAELVAERAAHAATKANLAAADAKVKELTARLSVRETDPFELAAENIVLKQNLDETVVELERVRAELLQSRRRLSEAFKQLDALGGTPARPPLNRDFVIQLHQQLDRWNRLLDEQHQRFAECDMLVARLKSSGFVRLTEYALLERNLQSTHTQLAEELARIGAVVNGDATQSQLFPAMRDRLQTTFAAISKRHAVVAERLQEIRLAKMNLQKNTERGTARLERAHKMITRTRIVAQELERLMRYHERWITFTSAVERAAATDNVVFVTADGYVCTSMSDLIAGLTGSDDVIDDVSGQNNIGSVNGGNSGASNGASRDNNGTLLANISNGAYNNALANSNTGNAISANSNTDNVALNTASTNKTLELFPLPPLIEQDRAAIEAADVREAKSLKMVQKEIQNAIRAREDLGAAVASYIVQKNSFMETFAASLARTTTIVSEEVSSFGLPDPRDTRLKELEFEASFLRDTITSLLSDTRTLVITATSSISRLAAHHARTLQAVSAAFSEAIFDRESDACDRGVLIGRISVLERTLRDDSTRLSAEELGNMDERTLTATYVAALEKNLEAARNSISFLGEALDGKSKALHVAESRIALLAGGGKGGKSGKSDGKMAENDGFEGKNVTFDTKNAISDTEIDIFDEASKSLSFNSITERLSLSTDVFLSTQRAAYTPPTAPLPLALQSPPIADTQRPLAISAPPSPNHRRSIAHEPRQVPPPPNPFSATGNGTAMPFTAVIDYDEPAEALNMEKEHEKEGIDREEREKEHENDSENDSESESDDDNDDENEMASTFSGVQGAEAEQRIEAEEAAERNGLQKSTSIFSWFFG